MIQGLILYAPNVHTGGGLVLLQGLLDNWPTGRPLRALLDARARPMLLLPNHAEVNWVRATLLDRWRAEKTLARLRGDKDVVLCFHGLPPLIAGKGQVKVFQQNRLNLGLTSLHDFPLKTRLRIVFERIVCKLLRHRVDEYWVQTDAMARDLRNWYDAPASACAGTAPKPIVRVFPFMSVMAESSGSDQLEWDFLYLADGVAHKNHTRLLQAWSILAMRGIYPTLALTLSERDGPLVQSVARAQDQGLKIVNLGQMPHDDALRLYRKARALIFPSLVESFGLPLAEAQRLGVPILASEMDYAYEVCQPAQTFDPYSPESIARAVMRFMGMAAAPVEIATPAQFLEAISQ